MQFGIFDWVEASARPPAEVYEHKLRARVGGRPRGLPRLLHRRAPRHAALDRRLAGRAALGDLPAHAQAARRRADLLPALVPPVPLLQRSVHARPDVARPARARRGPRRVADRVADFRLAQHRRIPGAISRDAGDLLRRLRLAHHEDQRHRGRAARQAATSGPIRRSGSRARTASRSSSPRATATTPRSSASTATASRSSSATASCGRSTGTTPAGTTRTSRRRSWPDAAPGHRRHRCRGGKARAEGLRDLGRPHPPPHAQARPARRAQDHALRRGFGAAADRRLAEHRARKSCRKCCALTGANYLLCIFSFGDLAAGGRDALARAFQFRSKARAFS